MITLLSWLLVLAHPMPPPPWPPPRPPPLRAARVEVAVAATPPCDAAAIRQTLVDQQEAIARCGHGARGRVQLRFAILPNGKAHAVRSRGSLPPWSAQCIVRRVIDVVVFAAPPARCWVDAKIHLHNQPLTPRAGRRRAP